MEVVKEWLRRVKKLLELYELVIELCEKSQARQAAYFNKHRRDRQFNISDRVWMKNQILSNKADLMVSKLAPKFNGPFVIKSKTSPYIYVLEDKDGNDVEPEYVAYLKKAENGPQTEPNTEKEGVPIQVPEDVKEAKQGAEEPRGLSTQKSEDEDQEKHDRESSR